MKQNMFSVDDAEKRLKVLKGIQCTQHAIWRGRSLTVSIDFD